jgi:hypothetical protein
MLTPPLAMSPLRGPRWAGRAAKEGSADSIDKGNVRERSYQASGIELRRTSARPRKEAPSHDLSEAPQVRPKVRVESVVP